MKMKCLALTLSALCIAGSALAAATWTDGTGDGLWSTGGNWSGGVVPPSGDSLFIKYNDTGATGPLFTDGMTYTARNLSFEAGTGGTLSMEMTGGDLTLNYFLRLGAGGSTGTAELNMSGDSSITAISNEGLIRLGSGYAGQLNMSGNASIAALDMTIDASNGSYVDLSDGASIILLGDVSAMVAAEILDGGFTSEGGTVNSVGYSVGASPTYGGAIVTTITAIPEPATLGLVVLVGGGLLWIRSRFGI